MQQLMTNADRPADKAVSWGGGWRLKSCDVHYINLLCSCIVASFPDSPHVAYIVLTFELAHTKSTFFFARASLKVNTIYAIYTRGRVWERG